VPEQSRGHSAHIGQDVVTHSLAVRHRVKAFDFEYREYGA
jgi:hypothetical protein